jgi:uncharacterized protein
VPRAALPFRTMVVCGSDDPWAELDRTLDFAGGWGADCRVLAGMGHINAESGVGDWPAGQDLLEMLFDERNPAFSDYPVMTAFA